MNRLGQRRRMRREAKLLDDSGIQWNILHPGELVATFLLPITDRLPLPAGQAFPNHMRFTPDDLDLLETEHDALLLQRTDRSAQPVPIALWDRYRRSEVVNWSNKWQLASSTLVHDVAANTALFAALAPAMRVASVVSGPKRSAEDLSELLKEPAPVADLASELGVALSTVAECAVGLRIVAPPAIVLPALGLDDGALKAAATAAELRGSRELRTASWPWVRLRGGDDTRDVLLERVQAALDIAIDDVQSLQRSVHAIRRGPRVQPTRERLPMVVPIVLRRLGDIGTPDLAPVDIVVVHAGPNPLDGEKALSDPELQDMAHIRSRVDNGPFAAFLDLQREAWVALSREGDFRLTSILSGTAAESLFDELLLHLQWEEGMTPESAASAWSPGLDTRVRTEFSRRLGGSWDARGTSPVGEWSRNVADIRHRVIHAGYSPSAREAHAAFDGVTNLITYLADRLASDSVLSRYPRTAVAVAGNEGLSLRERHTRRVKALQDADEPIWWETFARWREAWRRVMRDAVAPRSSDPASASLLFVVHGDGSERFCLHDATTQQAAAVEPEPSPEIETFLQTARELAQPSLDGDADRAMSIKLARSQEVKFSSIGPWVEEYRHVPMTQVMVDRSDYRQPR